MTEPEKMKVAELRAALQERGLDTKGTKPVLVARLQEAIEAEKKEPTPEPESEKVEESEAMEETPAEEAKEEVKEEEAKETKEEAMETEEAPKVDGEKKEEGKEEKKDDKTAPQGVKRKMDDEPFEVKENEPEIDEKLMCLDWHNSDLNLRILDTLMEGVPFSRDGWAFCYAAARATYGFTSGKVWYEVKYVDNMDVKIEKEPTTYDLRVGWSTNDASLMLGENDKSWCYSTAEGKMANNKKFEDYGEAVTKGDTIGAFIDFSQDEINVTFTKNGDDQGDAFQIAKSDLNGAALFPHIMTRNVKFEVNFGIDKEAADKDNWQAPLGDDYVKVGKVEEADRQRGTPRNTSRDQCEMIMMIGLPGCGKSVWVDKHVAENADKQYNVISTNTMINKMTVNGEPRKDHFKGKWETVVQKATRSLQEMLRAASQRRRNVIIDQTNVYPSAQKRKARPFEGFQRRAVVVVPSDDVYKERVAAQTAAGNKDIPDEAIMEMKANYALPEDESDAVVPMFKDVVFTELNREEATKVIELYNKIAKEKGYGKKHEERKLKKFKNGQNQNQKPGFKGKDQRGNNNQRGNRPMRGMRGRGGPPMRGGPWMRGRGGPMGGPMNRGGPMMRGRMGPSPWQGNNMGGPMRNNMGGGGPWNQGGNMNNMGGRGGMNNMGGGMNSMGGGMGMNNMGGGMNNMGGGMGMGMNNMGGGMNNMGGGMGMNNMNSGMGGMNGMGGGMNNMGGGMNNMGGGMGMNNMGGGMRQMNNMGGGMNQGGNFGKPTNTWSNNSGMGGGQNSFGGGMGGNRFGGNNQGRGGNQKFGGNRGGMSRGGGGGNRGMGFAGGRGGGNRGNRGRRF